MSCLNAGGEEPVAKEDEKGNNERGKMSLKWVRQEVGGY